MFGDRVMRRVFGPKRDDVTGERRKLHNEEIYDLYTSHNILFSLVLSFVKICYAKSIDSHIYLFFVLLFSSSLLQILHIPRPFT